MDLISTRTELLPRAFSRPIVMMAIGILPQLLLLAMNLSDGQRLYELLASPQRREWMLLVGSQYALLAAGLWMTLPALIAQRDIPFAWMPAWLVGSVGFAIAGMQLAGQIVDANTGFWMPGLDALGMRQALLVLPGAFLAGLRIAGTALPWSAKYDMGGSLAVAIGIPLGFYLFFNLVSSFWRGASSEMALLVVLPVLALLVVLAIMRVSVLVVNRWTPSPRSPARLFWLVTFGLACPLGGLLLNRDIPFPFDFQNPVFYALALLNGLLLVLPEPVHVPTRRALWFARAACFPYTVYFFVIFLPFTPFFLPALFVFGTGLLILAPIALFLVQGSLLWEGLSELRSAIGRTCALARALLALSLLPGIFLASAGWHRSTLHRALDYVYPGETAVPQKFVGNRFALRMVLDNVARARAEISMPFLSSWYDELVFDGLVLPERKLKDLYKVFFNEDLPEYKNQANEWNFFSDGGRNRRTDSWARGAPPPTSAELVKVAWTDALEPGYRRVSAEVEMHNPTTRQAEFATTVRLPPGGLVTGFWLYIEKEKVPGVIFEKKTALWVYHTIRDRTRRDPGILLYQPDGTVQFRVFPFDGMQTRRAVIEFSVPEVVAGTVEVGSAVHAMQPRRRDGIQVFRCNGGGLRLVAGPEAPLPKFYREPAVHLLVDSSRKEGWEAALLGAVRDARVLHGAKTVDVTLVSSTCVDLPANLPAEEETVLAAARKSAGPGAGGFFRDRGVRHAVWSHLRRASPSGADSPLALRRPLVLLTGAPGDGAGGDEHPGNLQTLAPDLFVLSSTNAAPVAPEVVVLRAGGQILAALPESGGFQQCFPAAPLGAEVEYLDPVQGRFLPLPSANLVTTPPGAMDTGTTLWLDQLRADTGVADPQMTLASRVKASRESGVMLPSTSYIVVEQAVQWQALKENEAKKLSGHAAFEQEDSTDTPEPPTWFWLLVLATWGLLRRQKNLGKEGQKRTT